MASKNPATNLGINKDYGSIAKDKFASFCILDDNLNVYMTIKKGEIIYSTK